MTSERVSVRWLCRVALSSCPASVRLIPTDPVDCLLPAELQRHLRHMSAAEGDICRREAGVVSVFWEEAEVEAVCREEVEVEAVCREEAEVEAVCREEAEVERLPRLAELRRRRRTVRRHQSAACRRSARLVPPRSSSSRHSSTPCRLFSRSVKNLTRRETSAHCHQRPVAAATVVYLVILQ